MSIVSIEALVEHAAHLLPEQAPLHAFVHHNTLHAFEHLPFDEAVVVAGEVLGTQPFQTEAQFADHLKTGRIRATDIAAVVEPMHQAGRPRVYDGGPTRSDFMRMRLEQLLELPRGGPLLWWLAETPGRSRIAAEVSPARRLALLEVARSFAGPGIADPEAALLTALWLALGEGLPTPDSPSVEAGPRPRDRILAATGVDTDLVVHPLLIRTCAAYLDQGIAYWPMPDANCGYLQAFRQLYRRRVAPPDKSLRGLPRLLRQHAEADYDAEATIDWALHAMEIDRSDWLQVITATLLSLRGWAGMMSQFEQRPDRAPVAARPARLIDYLAVQLVVDQVAAVNAMRDAGCGPVTTGRLDELARQRRRDTQCVGEVGPVSPNLELHYESFLLAQLLDIEVTDLLVPAHASAWVKVVAELDSIERRRLLHLAYEHRHEVEVLDGIAGHTGMGPVPSGPAGFQAVFCIDDREESLRRHLEERHPQAQTFGYAGFFNVAMYYQGLDDVRPRPLCPVNIEPKHLIAEAPLNGSAADQYARSRRRAGMRRHGLSVADKSLVRGSITTAVGGLASVIPLIGRCLFPRFAERVSHRLQHHESARPPTRLNLQREPDAEPDSQGLLHGYSIAEMLELVHAALQTMGLTDGFCPVVMIVGHGSSSLNNPHEAAHDCGATGGGRGGPNARAFAMMANHREVRAGLRERGVDIPDSCTFVGAYHNTCDDSMTYYDEDLIPPALRATVEDAQRAMADACTWDAHERCRRFEDSDGTHDAATALLHAETHARDLGQPRPEYGHATNAVCIVGRRASTRGLFLDRRAFLVSYDPTSDPERSLLRRLLLSVGPVGAGINLEYYFSYVDPAGYGSGTKLPHNIVGLFGVMDGHASDLRTGLPWQMVEIHEPVRLLTIIEAEPAELVAIVAKEPSLHGLIANGWIRVVAWSPTDGSLHVFRRGGFERYEPESREIPVASSSDAYYAHARSALGPAHITLPRPEARA